METKLSVDVACRPETLWAYISDPERQKLWLKGVVENRKTSEGPERAGSTFLMKVKEGRKVVDYAGEIKAFDEPTYLAVSMVGGCFKPDQEMLVEYRLTPSEAGTRLDYCCSIEMTGVVMKLFSPLFCLLGKFMVKGMFKKLKSLAEADGAAPQVA